MAQTLSLIIALTNGGFRCSGGVSSKYPKSHLFIVDVIFVNHGEMVDQSEAPRHSASEFLRLAVTTAPHGRRRGESTHTFHRTKFI